MSKDLQSIYTRYAPTLFKICLRYSSSSAEAEDLLHDSFIRIHERLPQYKGLGSFEGWLKKIVVSVALNRLRSNKYTPDYHEDFDQINESDIEVDNQELSEERIKLLDAGLTHDDVFECMQELPAKARAVFNLYVFESKKHKEIAQALDISTNTSKTQLKRARVLLHKQLMRRAEMKLKNIKRLSIFAFLFPGSNYTHFDKLVKQKINKSAIGAPTIDIASIASKSIIQGGSSGITGSVGVIGQIGTHIKTNILAYSTAAIVGGVGITAALVNGINKAEIGKRNKLEIIEPRSNPALLDMDLDSFLKAPLHQIEDKSKVSNSLLELKPSVDTITVYERVKVVDTLK